MNLVLKTKAKISNKNKLLLKQQMEQCRILWNLALEQKINIYRSSKETISVYDQKKQLVDLKKEFPEFAKVYNKYLSAILFNLDKAFINFFRRLKNKEKPGFPRFKGRNKLCSLEAPAMYCKKIDDYHIQIPQKIIIKTKDKIPDNLRTIYITYDVKENIYLSIIYDQPIIESNTGTKIQAFDLGIKNLAIGYDGEGFIRFNAFKQTRYFDRIVDKLRSRRDKCKKYSRKWKLLTKTIRRIYQTVSNRRENYYHHVSKDITSQADVRAIVVGDLSIKQMISKNRRLNREVHNRWSLNSLIQKLRYKSILNSKLFYEINESYTSKTCSRCGSIQEMPLHRRQYRCPECGLSLDRDENSAINIRKRSLAVLQPVLIN